MIAFITLLRREVIRILRIWPQTILPSVITTTLYFLIFGNLIGSRIGVIQGVAYIDFIAPGLIMMGIITNSYANVSSTFFGAKFQGNIDEMLVSTMSPNTLLLGFVSGGVVRGIIVGIIVSIISMWFTSLSIANLGLIVLIAALTSLLFSLAGLFNGIFAKKFDDITIIPTFVLTPFIYLGGVFYSINLLGPIWRKLSFCNPILYIINAFRYSFLGFSDIKIEVSLLLILFFTVLFYAVNLILISKSVRLRG